MDIRIKRVDIKDSSYPTAKYFMDCTSQIRELFGDVVKRAWVELTEVSLQYADDSVAKHIAEQTVKEFNKNKSFQFDSSDIFITFKNGKRIYIRNSEWGNIAPWGGELK